MDASAQTRPASPQKAARDWKIAEAPMLSKFADDVDPANPHPEYPRPQLAREQWQNLNGLWDLRFAAAGDDLSTPPTDGFDRRILVPFPVESALSGVGEAVPEGRVWYQRTFAVPEDWTRDGGRVRLNFGAVDWESHVFVNGQKVGEHRGGFDPFSLDITDALKAGQNTLAVGVSDPTNTGAQPRGKQHRNPSGIFYTPVTGIWQTVWMEPVPAAHIRSLRITPDVDAGEVEIQVDAEGGSNVPDGDFLEYTITDGDRVLIQVPGPSGIVRLKIRDAKLWSPASPHLYGLKVRYNNDEVTSYFGMRKVELGRDDRGMVTSIKLNGQPLFQVGPLDQGWWPDGLYTAPTDAALRYDIEATKDLGFNMIRKHVKVEPARWYYWADKLGVLVWQDMPSGAQSGQKHGIAPTDPNDADLPPEARAQFEAELLEMIADFGNHPSIIMWVVFNEGWGQHDTARLTALTKELDPTRLASNASGWTDRGVGDVMDLHHYPEPVMPPLEKDRVAVLGEFGGVGLALEGHLWQKDRLMQYRGARDSEALTRDYETYFRDVYKLRDAGLAAAVYTQTTDVEGEINGLLTYDREVVKVDAERARKANLGQLEQYDFRPLVATASAEGGSPTWRYTTTAPADGWEKPDFEATGWKQGTAGFGAKDTRGAAVNTPWDTSDIWLRHEFDLSADALKQRLALRVRHDEDATVYLNGQKVLELAGFNSGYGVEMLGDEATAALREGRNVIAVHCRQTTGGQYIDVGLSAVTPRPPRPREDAE